MHYSILINYKIQENETHEDAIINVMDKFIADPINPAYTKFISTDITMTDYLNRTMPAIKLPEGKLVPVHSGFWGNSFFVRDGKAYQRGYGKNKTRNRSKKAKKLKYIPKCSVSKVYPTFDQYMKEDNYCEYDEESKSYGNYYNQNTEFDWYQIGGRWPYTFLVKENAKCISDIFSWMDRGCAKETPQGYKWVGGARKCDIEWDLMKKIAIKNATAEYYDLKLCFETGNLSEKHPNEDITSEGIFSDGNPMYLKDETLDEFLKRCKLGENNKYPIAVYALIDDGDWKSSFYVDEKDDWHTQIENYIAKIEDNDWIVAIDCHI